MKVYPVILIPNDGVYTVEIPDFDAVTEGKDLADAIFMARDCIGINGAYLQDKGREIPNPGTVAYTLEDGQFVAYIDIDFDSYRKEVDTKAVRINVTVPRNLKTKAEAAGVSFSHELQVRLREILGVA